MSSTTQPTTFSDLYTDLLNRMRADTTSGTTTEGHAKRAINGALMDMHIGFREKFPWAERTAQLITQQDYTTGTISISQGSTTLTGSSTVWTTNNAFGVANARAGGKIQINGQEIYEVSSVGGATTITLTSKYVGADVAAGSSYKYFEDEYALASDFLRPVEVNSFDLDASIELVDRKTFRREFVRNNTPGRPTVATIVDKAFGASTARSRKIIFARPPGDFYLIPYSYITTNLAVASNGTEAVSLSADTDEPIVPLQYRHIIVLHALKNWYRDKKNDPRSQVVASEYTDAMIRLAQDGEIGSPRSSIEPRNRQYKNAARRPWRGLGSRPYQTNGEFDRLEI